MTAGQRLPRLLLTALALAVVVMHAGPSTGCDHGTPMAMPTVVSGHGASTGLQEAPGAPVQPVHATGEMCQTTPPAHGSDLLAVVVLGVVVLLLRSPPVLAGRAGRRRQWWPPPRLPTSCVRRT